MSLIGSGGSSHGSFLRLSLLRQVLGVSISNTNTTTITQPHLIRRIRRKSPQTPSRPLCALHILNTTGGRSPTGFSDSREDKFYTSSPCYNTKSHHLHANTTRITQPFARCNPLTKKQRRRLNYSTGSMTTKRPSANLCSITKPLTGSVKCRRLPSW